MLQLQGVEIPTASRSCDALGVLSAVALGHGHGTLAQDLKLKF